MSDFLGRLAARALGTEVPLRPRVASRFEPETSPPDPLSHRTPLHPGEGEAMAGEPLASPVASAPVASLGVARPLVEPASVVSPTVEISTHRAVEPQRRSRPSLPSPPDPLSHTHSPLPGEGAPPPARDRLGSSLRANVERAVSPRLEAGMPGLDGAAETRRRIPDHVLALDRASARDQSAPLVSQIRTGWTLGPSDVVSQTEQPGEGSPSPGGKGGRWERGPGGEVPGRAAASSSEASPATPAVAPPIRVTIGRIEVRATAPAPPPAAPRPVAGPRMNLEDYLRRRREGKL